MPRSLARFLIGFAVVAVMVVAALVILGPSAPAPPPPPNPNGYDDLVKAGQSVSSDVSDWPRMGKEDLLAILVKEAEALKLARAGLGRECRVPLDSSLTNGAHLQDLAAFKRLAQTFAAEGKLAQLEERPGDAARSYLDTIRLGHEATRGGVTIHSLVGLAIEAIGLSGLEPLVPKLDAKQCRESAAALEGIEARREPLETIRKQEQQWARRTYGFRGQIARWVAYLSLKQIEQKWAGRVQANEARTQKVLVELAARAFELEKGERPKNLADLVPTYLKAVPRDPVTGTNMVYRP